MTRRFCLTLCSLAATIFFCCRQSNTTPAVATPTDTLQINNRINAKEKSGFAFLSDSVKLPSSAKASLPYVSVTRFYYDSVNKELFKAENIFPATGRPVFVAYFDKNNVVKTIARTEFGWYDYYFSPKEEQAINNDSGKTKSGHRNRLRQQCFQLAEEQLAVFQHKIKG